MKKILLYLFLISPLFSVGQSKPNDSVFKNTVVNISMPDTLSLNSIDNNKKDSNPLEKNMPWIAATYLRVTVSC